MRLFITALFVALTSAGISAADLSLWYRRPATNWVTEALPIGNGDMGAMIFGGIGCDRVQFNHKTLWKGSDKPGDLGSYLSFGDLFITELDSVGAQVEVSDYIRRLDLTTAVASVGYRAGDATYRREYLASFPDEVIAIHYQADSDRKLNLSLKLVSAQGAESRYRANGASFAGTLANGMSYCAAIRVAADGGTTLATDSALTVSGASAMTVYLACATNFDPAAAGHLANVDPAEVVAASLDNAAAKGYESVRSSHVADYSNLFGRVDFELDGAANDRPTNELLAADSIASATAMTDMLIFAYGRYLTIASSRGIAVPSNLQGIWNKDGNATSSAVWASDIHSNINVQMNYWPVEPTNLSECHMPLLNYLYNEAMRSDGAWSRNARDLGAGQGWVVNTASNIFGGSSGYKVGKYSVANAWLCDHLWQHYAYTLDSDYLRLKAWPVMRSAARFWLERLVPAANGDGTLECPNEYSPEQGEVQNATAHAQQLVGMLFANSLRAIDALGDPADTPLADSIAAALKKLDPGLRVDSNGLLREWKYRENTPNQAADSNHFANDEANVWQGHRHTSHLMGLYPGFSIDPGIDADIFNAAVASLADRGDVATGWGRAWRTALWARARNAGRAYDSLRGFAHRTDAQRYDWHGGLYDNMLDAHATSVFQIEGNFGATAAIAEMLLQSRPDSLVILPALPAAWAGGSIRGLKTIGNHEVDLSWKDGRLTKLRIKSNAGGPLLITCPGIGRRRLQTLPGQEYNLTF